MKQIILLLREWEEYKRGDKIGVPTSTANYLRDQKIGMYFPSQTW
jgi:hypothetical protein